MSILKAFVCLGCMHACVCLRACVCVCVHLYSAFYSLLLFVPDLLLPLFMLLQQGLRSLHVLGQLVRGKQCLHLSCPTKLEGKSGKKKRVERDGREKYDKRERRKEKGSKKMIIEEFT